MQRGARPVLLRLLLRLFEGNRHLARTFHHAGSPLGLSNGEQRLTATAVPPHGFFSHFVGSRYRRNETASLMVVHLGRIERAFPLVRTNGPVAVGDSHRRVEKKETPASFAP